MAALLVEFQEIPEGDLSKIRELGRGSYGVAYLGSWRGIEVVIKELSPDAPQSCIDGFLEEIIALARLRHPNIVAVWGRCRRRDGGTSLVLQFALGGTLRDRIRRAMRPLPLRVSIRALRDVARGLEHAHGSGYSHNDIKCDNILIDAHENCMVADFGLALFLVRLGRQPAEHQGHLGTIGWTAPENMDPGHPAYGKVTCVYHLHREGVGAKCVSLMR